VFLWKTYLNVSLDSKIKSNYCTSLITYIRRIHGASKTEKLPLYLRPHSESRKHIHMHTYNSDDGEYPDYFFYSAIVPSGPGPRHYRGFTITHGHNTLGRIPLDEWSARCRGIWLTTHNTHKRQAYMPTAEFESAIPESERSQIHALHEG